MIRNPILSGALSLGIAAWCAYDLWLANDPGSSGGRILNYFLLVMALMGFVGSFMLARPKE